MHGQDDTKNTGEADPGTSGDGNAMQPSGDGNAMQSENHNNDPEQAEAQDTASNLPRITR